MRNVALFALGLAVAVGVSVRAATVHTNEAESSRYARACVWPVGGATTIDPTAAAAAYSAQLTAWTRYVVQCNDDAYVATDDAASGAPADASDLYIPLGSWWEMLTTDTVRYVSLLCKSSDCVCRIWECQ